MCQDEGSPLRLRAISGHLRHVGDRANSHQTFSEKGRQVRWTWLWGTGQRPRQHINGKRAPCSGVAAGVAPLDSGQLMIGSDMYAPASKESVVMLSYFPSAQARSVLGRPNAK